MEECGFLDFELGKLELVWVQADNIHPSVLAEDLFRLTQITSAFPFIVHYIHDKDGDPTYKELTWDPIEMLNLKHFNEFMVLYVLHSPFVKEM